MSRLLISSLVLSVLTSCFGSDIPSGALRCDEGQTHPCPSGMVCVGGACHDENVALDSRVGPDSDGGAEDFTADAAAPFTCSAPSLVGNPTEAMLEPALRAGGLVLMARNLASGYSEATRSSQSHPFGDWAQSTSVLADGSDLNFFFANTEERVIKPVGDSPRSLVLCELDNSCTPITLVELAGATPIEDDVDGPNIADALSELILVFDRGNTLWIAAPSTPGALDHWSATEIAIPATRPGDPAISPDGLVLVYDDKEPTGDAELWVVRRSRVDAPFSTPEILDEVNSSAAEFEPELALLPSGELELFFSSGRQDFSKIYRSICQ